MLVNRIKTSLPLLLLFLLLSQTLTAQIFNQQTFLQSFIQHYEFNPEGRYTHEYHPFLLEWTSKSLDQLEHRLRDEAFNLNGRIIIMGYEEQAVPQYYTNFRQSKINDEATRKNHAGWSLRLHNRFGFMTGFLFKDLPYLQQRGLVSDVYEHIDADLIRIFDDRAFIFHEHAFGQALPLMREKQKRIHNKLISRDDKAILSELDDFWKMLYTRSLKIGNSQVAGTQDVLFSVAYAHHLFDSPLPLFKFFIGPDLTYPIEVTAKQDRFATVHSQHFTKQLVQQLNPVDNKNTVYVFCSFVDGVGKSTMLGNIKNWMKFGSEIEKFDHVDNSSSQLCTLFQYKDKVFVADLPAQVSHFTYKPDGQVFVDIQTFCSNEEIKKIEEFITSNEKELSRQRASLFASTRNIIEHKGFHDPLLNSKEAPFFAFAKNAILLHNDETLWTPFLYDDKYYIYKESMPREIRCLTPLGLVKSEGLKNIEADQMLFFDGIRLPLAYNDFLDDLINQFKQSGIENVVFVDFLSMYPRSSRENVRVNYLLQQMALLEESFQPRFSLYRDFVSGGELLHTLLDAHGSSKIRQACALEAKIRLALFKILITRSQGDLKGVDLVELTDIIVREIKGFSGETLQSVDSLTLQKMKHEIKELEKLYGLSKSFVNIQHLSLKKIAAFSNLLVELFSKHCDYDVLNALWQPIAPPVPEDTLNSEGEFLNKTMINDDSEIIRAIFVLHEECKNEILLTPILRSLRANWYASILNLLRATSCDGLDCTINKTYVYAVPLQFVQAWDDTYYLVQRPYDVWQKNLTPQIRNMFRPFNFTDLKPSAYCSMGEAAFRVEWNNKGTYEGLFGFDCQLLKDESKQHMYDPSTVSRIVQDYQRKHNVHTVIPAFDLWESLSDDICWQFEQRSQRNRALNNGVYKDAPNTVPGENFSPFGRKSRKLVLATKEQSDVARLVIRLLATLEMIMKDPETDVAVRNGNRDDFKAALKLYEHVVFPTYSRVVFSRDLFDDYDTVEPYPSWDFWDRVEN